MSVIRGARLVVFDNEGRAPELRASVIELTPKPGSGTPGVELYLGNDPPNARVWQVRPGLAVGYDGDLDAQRQDDVEYTVEQDGANVGMRDTCKLPVDVIMLPRHWAVTETKPPARAALRDDRLILRFENSSTGAMKAEWVMHPVSGREALVQSVAALNRAHPEPMGATRKRWGATVKAVTGLWREPEARETTCEDPNDPEYWISGRYPDRLMDGYRAVFEGPFAHASRERTGAHRVRTTRHSSASAGIGPFPRVKDDPNHAYAAYLRLAAARERLELLRRHRSIYRRATAGGVVALAATTAFGIVWLGLGVGSALLMLGVEVLLGGGAILGGVPNVSQGGRAVWAPTGKSAVREYGRFSPGGRLLAWAVVVAVLGVAGAAGVVAVGHHARVAGSPQGSSTSTTTTQTTATSVTTPTRTSSTATTVTTTVTATPPPTAGGSPDYGPGVWRVLLGGTLGLLAAVTMYAVTLGTNIIWANLRNPNDPYAILLVALVHANGLLARELSRVSPETYGTLTVEQRRWVAEPLGRAIRYAPGAALTSPVGGQFVDDTVGSVQDRVKLLTAWLEQRQAELLWPAPTYEHPAPGDTNTGNRAASGQLAPEHPARESLAVGLLDACQCNWAALEGTIRTPTPSPFEQQVRKFVPRALFAGVLAAVAFVLPDLLFASSDAARGALQVTLLGVAVTALAAPADALGKASDSVASAVSAKDSS
jgi:hypothetical protein